MAVALAASWVFIWYLSDIMSRLEALFAGKVSSALALSCLSRMLCFCVRALINLDTSLPVDICNVVTMVLLSFSTIEIRRSVLDQSNQNPLSLLVNYLKLAAVEIVARSVSYVAQILKIGNIMTGLNMLTLCELVDLHTRVQRRVKGIISHLLVDQFVEIFVFVMITAQDLSAPIWSYIRVWMSAGAWGNRFPYILMQGSIQIVIEFFVDLFIWRLCFHRLAWDIPQVIRSVLFKKPVAVFVMGVMLMPSLNFFPNCMTCNWPVHCLAFTECLHDGEVMVNGQNQCTTHIHNWTNYAEIVVQEARLRMIEVSPEQLGCGHQHVDCFGLGDKSSSLSRFSD